VCSRASSRGRRRASSCWSPWCRRWPRSRSGPRWRRAVPLLVWRQSGDVDDARRRLLRPVAWRRYTSPPPARLAPKIATELFHDLRHTQCLQQCLNCRGMGGIPLIVFSPTTHCQIIIGGQLYYMTYNDLHHSFGRTSVVQKFNPQLIFLQFKHWSAHHLTPVSRNGSNASRACF